MMGISLFAIAVTNPMTPAFASGVDYSNPQLAYLNQNGGDSRPQEKEETVPGLTVVNGVCVAGNGGGDYGLPEGSLSARFSCSVPGDASTYNLECLREINGDSTVAPVSDCLGDAYLSSRIAGLFNEQSGSNISIILDNDAPSQYRVEDPDGTMSCGSSRYMWDVTPIAQCGGLVTGFNTKCSKATRFGDGPETWTEAPYEECEAAQGPPDEESVEDWPEAYYGNCTNLRVITGPWTPAADTQCGEFAQSRTASCVYDSAGGQVTLPYAMCANAENYFVVEDTYALEDCVADSNNATFAEVLENCEPYPDTYGYDTYIPKASRTATGTMSSCAGGDGADGRFAWSFSAFPAASGCGTVTQTRPVTCVDTEDNNNTVSPEACNAATKPQETRTTENVVDQCAATCFAEPVIGNCATRGYDRLIASNWRNFATPTLGSSGTCNQVTSGSTLYRHDTFVDASCPAVPSAVAPTVEPGGSCQSFDKVEVYFAWESDCRNIESINIQCEAGTKAPASQVGDVDSPVRCGQMARQSDAGCVPVAEVCN